MRLTVLHEVKAVLAEAAVAGSSEHIGKFQVRMEISEVEAVLAGAAGEAGVLLRL
jgi:hypothetical protein